MRKLKGLELVGVIAAAITLVLPVDLIPDFMPVIGWLDDLLAIGYLVVELLKFIRNRRQSLDHSPYDARSTERN